MPIVSVIVPVYKVEPFLHRCVDSILAQTQTDFELILVDDGSPDDCGEICEEYAAKDSRIIVIYKENGGQAAARNRAIAIAKAEWICFVDADDCIHPQMLQLMLETADCKQIPLICCEYLEANEVPDSFFQGIQLPSCAVIPMTEENLLIQKKGVGTYWVAWTKLLRKQLTEDYPFYEGRYFEDNGIVYRWLYESKNIAKIPAPLYYYQMNLQGTTKSPFSVKHLDRLWALSEQISFYDSIGYTKLRNSVVIEYLIAYKEYRKRAKESNIGKAAIKRMKDEARTFWRMHYKIILCSKANFKASSRYISPE